MESIRAAAGKPKRSQNTVIERKLRAKRMQKEDEVVSGDLMSDLFNKLALRRKGISGANQAANTSDSVVPPSSAMDKISAMIPPPAPSSAPQEDDSNSDWDN